MKITILTENSEILHNIFVCIQKNYPEWQFHYVNELPNQLQTHLIIMPDQLEKIDIAKVAKKLNDQLLVVCLPQTTNYSSVNWLKLGADLVWSFPESPGEFYTIVESLIRIFNKVLKIAPTQKKQQGIWLDTENQIARKNQEEIPLTKAEYEIMKLFIEHPHRVYSREDLLHFLGNETGSTRVVDTHIKNLRKKIEVQEGKPKLIETVHGRGYRFVQ